MTNKRAKALTLKRLWNCKLCPICGGLPSLKQQLRTQTDPFPVGYRRGEVIAQLKCCTLKGPRAVGIDRAVGQWNKKVWMFTATGETD